MQYRGGDQKFDSLDCQKAPLLSLHDPREVSARGLEWDEAVADVFVA